MCWLILVVVVVLVKVLNYGYFVRGLFSSNPTRVHELCESRVGRPGP